MIKQRRIMFVKNSQPLVGVRVRLGKVSGGLVNQESRETLPNMQAQHLTDQDGQISCELDSGVSFLDVFDGEEWVECRLEVTEKQSLFVVDLHTHTTGSFKQITGGMGAISGQVLGERYIFENVIGRGGMGVVLRAQDKLLHRDVAIKMLNDEFLENMEAQKIFLEEARSIATLRHPNLVGIYDVTMIDERAMIVFEFIEGRDLDSLFEEVGRLSEASVLRLGVQLTRALKYLHSRGILHRDIKPANVLMQPDGMIKIIDFGLARPLEQLAIKGTRVRGTPAYMAPEQIEGGQLLAATDIYQLGVSLYEVLSGQLPFSTGNMAYAHVHLDPPDLNESMSLHEPKLATLIHACLSKRPEDRPSAEELFQAFQAIYASHVAFYDADTSGVIPNADALFSETTELTIPDWLYARAERETLSEMPAVSTRATAGAPDGETSSIIEDDELQPEGLQRLLVVALALILLLLGLGGVIVMLISAPSVKEDVASKPAEIGALDAPSSPPTAKESATSTSSTPGPVDVLPTTVQDKASPENEPLIEDEPLDEEEAVVSPEPVQEEDEVSNSRVAPREPSSKETTGEQEDVTKSFSKTAKKKPPVDEAPADPSPKAEPEVKPAEEPPVVSTPTPVVRGEETAPASSKEEEETETSSDPETRVIRKRIIRKRIIRKTPAVSADEEAPKEEKSRAPVSF